MILALSLPVACGEGNATGPTTSGDASSGSTSPGTTSEETSADDGSTSGSADGSSSSGTPPGEACNGHVELCDRAFDQVVFPGTHNSHSATDDGFSSINANHVHGIATQLDDGARVLLLDVYPGDDDPSVLQLCHGECALGSTPHLDALTTIVAFLEQHPREVITIIYEDHAPVDDMVAELALAGADALTFTHEAGQPWPTLGEMIEADTRLVVTAESGGPPPAWFHHVWDEAWDTPYGPQQLEDLSCDLNRGSPDNDLFLVNHWVNDVLGLPSPEDAAVANAYDVLLGRAQECWRQWDHPPNFLVVDFYEQGDLFAVVDALNGVGG